MPTGPKSKRAIDVGNWNYPRGGKRIQLIKGLFSNHKQIDGVTLSLAPSS